MFKIQKCVPKKPKGIEQIKTVKHYNMLLLQVNGNTVQGLWRRNVNGFARYESDTFPIEYKTIREAKEHIFKLILEKYWWK